MNSAVRHERIPLYSLYGQLDQTVPLDFLHLEPIEASNRIYQWNIRPHRHHDLHQIIWVADGQGMVELDTRTLSLQAPVLINVPRTVVHGFQWLPGTDGLVLTLAESFMQDILRISRDPSTMDIVRSAHAISGAIPAKDLARLKLLFRTLVDEYIHDRGGRISALAGLTSVLVVEVARLRHLSVQPTEDTQDTESYAICQRFRDLVETHFRDHWPVADYAERLATTERSLRRHCLDGIGLSPLQIIHRRLFIEARRELIYTQQTTSEIAYQLGFSDPAYFTRFFARNSGNAPTEFRRRYRPNS
ncbi:MAG: helix-turn-helix domain-containing protein [Castellaniella sp.]|uniref:helix-turn-helix domain-containing protein n=1 Tax=Castellaniella sp. TaxID=1955812 RepID=UPI0012111DEF|nr:helix-turn-helix domain-containing protein [Castellaniella sp.]TAN27572.1 MAG: helix-turn-helix domain-containing protein [Castellaniella sp.]